MSIPKAISKEQGTIKEYNGCSIDQMRGHVSNKA